MKRDQKKKKALRNKEKLSVLMQRNVATRGGKERSANILNRITASGFHF